MNNDYRISDAREEMDTSAIHEFLSQSYWSQNIPLQTVQRAIDNSVCFGVFYQDQQIGFGRVVTDRATFGYLADVYILEPHRGQGLSVRLMEAILQHPDLQGLRRFMLATRDAHNLYAKFGFTPIDQPQRLMQRLAPDVYLSNNIR